MFRNPRCHRPFPWYYVSVNVQKASRQKGIMKTAGIIKFNMAVQSATARNDYSWFTSSPACNIGQAHNVVWPLLHWVWVRYEATSEALLGVLDVLANDGLEAAPWYVTWRRGHSCHSSETRQGKRARIYWNMLAWPRAFSLASCYLMDLDGSWYILMPSRAHQQIWTVAAGPNSSFAQQIARTDLQSDSAELRCPMPHWMTES